MNSDTTIIRRVESVRRSRVTVSSHLVAWLVLAIALAASAGGWYIAREHENLTARKRFEEEASRIQTALQQRLSIYQDVLHGGVGLFAASISVERAEWKAYVEKASVNERFRGMGGFGFIAYVPRTNLDDFLNVTRADATPKFELKNPGTNADFFIIKYLEPKSEYVGLIGYDVGVDPDRRAVAEKARDTGTLAMSSRLTLHVRGPRSETQGGLWMILPVFRNGTSSATLADRQANIEGWVYARFVTSYLMNNILDDKSDMLRFEVVERKPHGELAPIYDTDEQTNTLEHYQSQFTSTGSVAVGQTLWLLRFTAKPAFEATISRGLETLVAVGGGLISLLLFGITLSLASTRARAVRMADEMTAAFREANTQLQKEIKEREVTERRTAIQHAVTRVLAEAETVAEAAPKIVQTVCESLGWDFGALWLIDPNQNHLRCVEVWHCPRLGTTEFETETRQKIFSSGEGLPGRIWATAKCAWIKDVAWDNNFARAPFAAKAGLHAAFGFPLLLGDELLGVVEFFSHQIVEPDEELIQLVSTLGSQIGQFIQRKQAQHELVHEQFLLRTIMDNLPDRIYFKDQQSRFIRNSLAHLKRLGIENQRSAIGKTDFDFLSAETARRTSQDEQQVIRSGEPITKEEKSTYADGRVGWALITKMPLRDETGKIIGTFGISRDITARKRAEEAMLVAKEAAEEANRTKSQFLANMSHELRTPLNSVIGFAGILLKNKTGDLSANELNFLERIQANGKHLLSLINEVLDLSKIEAGKMELQIAPVALDILAQQTISQQEGLVRDRPVQLLAEIPSAVAPIEADADKLRQVIINLIGNALKFTERGSVTVRVVADPKTKKPLRIDVIDTGIGIPKEKLGVIFQAFQQADATTARKYGGTGLGLTISQALCQFMGFHIEVASEVGQGSTFSVILSRKEDSAANALPDDMEMPVKTDAPVASAPSDLKGKLVLVIDDESDSRILMTHVLEEFGCQVIAANSGEQGLRMAREFKPQIITTDLLMPQMDGASVIRHLKADPELRKIPVVVVSIVAEERRGSILGAVDILEKPIAREELLNSLRRCLLPAQPKILIVDDEADARQILISHLAEEKVEIQTATNGQEALAALENFPADLILLDLVMPVMDGVAFLGAIRADSRYQHLPVVVITSKDLTLEEKNELRRQTLEIIKKTELSEENFKPLLERILKARTKSEPPKSATG